MYMRSERSPTPRLSGMLPVNVLLLRSLQRRGNLLVIFLSSLLLVLSWCHLLSSRGKFMLVPHADISQAINE